MRIGIINSSKLLCFGHILSLVLNVLGDSCQIVGFKVVLPTGVPECEQWGLFRDVSLPLDSGFLVCREIEYGRNIEAITSGNCSASRISFILQQPNGSNTSRIEKIIPFYLYGDNNGSIMSGNFNQLIGLHRLAAFPVDHKRLGRNISFNVIDCMNFSPPNDCSNCLAKNQVCEGSMCVLKGYIRISLMAFGFDLWDEGTIVTTPVPGGIFGSVSNDSIPTIDPAGSGGYVETDFNYGGSCRSQGVWTKNIVFPKSTLAPKGVYNVDVSSNAVCFDDNFGVISSAPVRKQQFVLKIFINEILQAQYTEADGHSFTFTNK